MADQEQTEGITQEEQVFLDRVGIVLRGAKHIGAYMGVSAATVVRWRRRFRGREEWRLCFPAFLVPTGRGHAFQLWSHTALIKEWMERWSQIDCAEAQGKAKWRRRTPRMKRVGETRKELAGQFGDKTEQTAYARHAHKCPTNHEVTPPQRELGVKVPETPKIDVTVPKTSKLDVIAPEEEPRSIVEGGLPPTTQPHPALTRKPMCTCGTLTTCIAHD